MRMAWFLQGLGYVIIVGALIFLANKEPADVMEQRLEVSTSSNSMTISTSTMRVRSPAFFHEDPIPAKYTCDGDDISPPLAIDGAPKKTASFVLVVDDPDAPGGTWDHWIEFNIPGTTTRIGEGTDPVGTQGKNSWHSKGYGGPCPPNGEHRYLFKVYALNTWLRLPQGASKKEVLDMMQGHVLESTTLMGRYTRIEP